ncbi:conserved hypothetical protein [Verrucomicrobia bacterium]|nr:conserved hypothetical protein [Verrucomicrobiota bacterium]
MPKANELNQLLATPKPPELGPGPRVGVQSEAALDRTLELCSLQGQATGYNQELVRALILLWHDHLEAAHAIAQSVESADAAFVHGIMHRREPDYDNARYWFRRVGTHPAFMEIARRVSTMPGIQGQNQLLGQLLPQGKWDPFGFIAACETAAERPASDSATRFLGEVQRIETEALLWWLCGAAEASKMAA